MQLSTMSYEVRDGVAHLRFTRPDGANAVNRAFAADLKTVMIEVEHALADAGEYEGRSIMAAMKTANGKEGIAAFAERRAPDYT